MKHVAGLVTTALAVAAVLTLTGCTSGAGDAPIGTESAHPSTSAGPTVAAPSQTASAAPSPPSLDDLHQQYLASGLPCDWMVTDNLMLGTVASGGCTNSENSISTFAAQADVDALLKRNTDSVEPGLFLVGVLWVVGSEHPEDLITAQATMGGDLWPADSAFFAGR